MNKSKNAKNMNTMSNMGKTMIMVIILSVSLLIMAGCASKSPADGKDAEDGNRGGAADANAKTPATTPAAEQTTEQESSCIDECGDGACFSDACTGPECPCTETVSSCPEDCTPAGQDIDNELKACGDGFCARLECFGAGCPTAENSENCPEDCG